MSVKDAVEKANELKTYGYDVAVALPMKGEAKPVTVRGGTFEEQYKARTGKRLRLSGDEQTCVDSGQCTREDIAKERLAVFDSLVVTQEIIVCPDMSGEDPLG